MCKKLDYLQDYFFVVYDYLDNYINSFDNIEDPTKFFNIEKKELLRKIREKKQIEHRGNLYRVYMFKKSKMIVSDEMRATIKLFAETGRKNEQEKITTGRHI